MAIARAKMKEAVSVSKFASWQQLFCICPISLDILIQQKPRKTVFKDLTAYFVYTFERAEVLDIMCTSYLQVCELWLKDISEHVFSAL